MIRFRVKKKKKKEFFIYLFILIEPSIRAWAFQERTTPLILYLWQKDNQIEKEKKNHNTACTA